MEDANAKTLQQRVAPDVLAEVAAERRRQAEPRPDGEGFTAAQDDGYINGELARAAACYAHPDRPMLAGYRDRLPPRPAWWPERWSAFWWKPKDRRRDLIRAIALLVAEVEQLDRAEAGAEK